jgi:hypothetical protein
MSGIQNLETHLKAAVERRQRAIAALTTKGKKF